MNFLPVFLDVRKRLCLVVGGGDVAARKVQQLLNAGARVRVVAPALAPALQTLHARGEIEHIVGEFSPGHLQDCILAVAATGDGEINRTVSDLARERRLPVNVVDNPSLCTFIMPSVVDRSPVVIAISTGGASPVLARLLRARLETLIPSAYGRLADLMRSFRERVKARFPDMRRRRRFWEEILQGPIAEMLFAGQDKAALAALGKRLGDEGDEPWTAGEVYLVGAGPGDPDLLTFRALRLMQQAEVVLYDRLVAPAIVDLVRRDAERIYVGKESDRHTLSQEEINALLIRLAGEGKRVLRLKGGDPFIFGRGGEEIDTLAARGIPFQVVPGITAAAGCSAYAGIPLTHRDYAQSCVFVTGHVRDGRFDLNWDALIQPRQTIAVYMGVGSLAAFCRELIRHGMAAATPAALIQQGTTPRQRVFTGDLTTLPPMIEKEEIKPPSMVIVGEVVKLHEKLAWYEPAAVAPDT
jgi:uroporphyrin-III C-methyltransferase/precorrin-2 dehydrogenase/sirohydrochlorin ferrochelatase